MGGADMSVDLGDGYTLQRIPLDAYRAAYAPLEGRVFHSASYAWDAPAPPTTLPTLTWGVYHADALVGWHCARQWDGRTLYMVNTGLLPEHQGRRVYTRMLPHLLQAFRSAGYTLVRSHHHATNNAVIIPKLRAGFLIQGLEMDDHGLMVVLTYSFDATYREALRIRSGHARPTGDAARRLGLHPLEDTP